MREKHHMKSISRAIDHCRITLVIGLIAISTGQLSGQLNLKIGYTLGFYSPEVHNNIVTIHDMQRSLSFDQYNEARPLNLAFGINLGLRYKTDFGNFEFSWESLARTTSSVGILRPPDPAPLSSSSNEFRYRFNMLMVTYESIFGLIGVGSTLGVNLASLDQVVQGTTDEFDLLGESPSGNDQYFARLHLSFNFAGNSSVAFAIKPYIQIPITNIDLSSFASVLDVQNAETQESYPAWGLSFTFYNGRQ